MTAKKVKRLLLAGALMFLERDQACATSTWASAATGSGVAEVEGAAATGAAATGAAGTGRGGLGAAGGC